MFSQSVWNIPKKSAFNVRCGFQGNLAVGDAVCDSTQLPVASGNYRHVKLQIKPQDEVRFQGVEMVLLVLPSRYPSGDGLWFVVFNVVRLIALSPTSYFGPSCDI